jgi:hypothetical protein
MDLKNTTSLEPVDLPCEPRYCHSWHFQADRLRFSLAVADLLCIKVLIANIRAFCIDAILPKRALQLATVPVRHY